MSFGDDWASLVQVCSEYASFADTTDWDGMETLFVDDAEVILGPFRFAGRPEIREGMAERMRVDAMGGDPTLQHPTQHVMTTPNIKLEGDRATGRWYLLAMFLTTPAGESPLKLIGEYEMNFVRDGSSWLIQRVQLFYRWSGDDGRLVEDS